MRSLILHYKDSEGAVTERRVTDIELDTVFLSSAGESKGIDAFCELRQERRTFLFKRIAKAIDADTGEIVPDLRAELGLPPRIPVAPIRATDLPLERRVRRTGHSAELYQGQRQKEKQGLQRRYRYEIVYEIYRDRLFSAFGNQCFKCGSPDPLVMDHHVPMILGGELLPGNIVVLCRRCNGVKLDQHPEAFYRPEELKILREILDQQPALMDFSWDHDAWNSDPRGYLLSLGLPVEVMDQFMEDRAEAERESIGVRFTIS